MAFFEGATNLKFLFVMRPQTSRYASFRSSSEPYFSMGGAFEYSPLNVHHLGLAMIVKIDQMTWNSTCRHYGGPWGIWSKTRKVFFTLLFPSDPLKITWWLLVSLRWHEYETRHTQCFFPPLKETPSKSYFKKRPWLALQITSELQYGRKCSWFPGRAFLSDHG